MVKTLGSELNESLDPISSREERKATGRMVAVIVALLMIFSGFYHAWIKKIPVLAGVMVPVLIMFLYAAWVLFLAKREKQRRLNAENQLRHSATALSEILVLTPEPATSTVIPNRKTRRGSHDRNHHLSSHGHTTHHQHHHDHHKQPHHKHCKNHHHRHRHEHHQHRPSCGSNEFRVNHKMRPALPPLPPVPVLPFDRHIHMDEYQTRPSAQTLFRSLSAR